MNYSYLINSTYCESTLRKFDLIKSYFLFSPLYAKTQRPIVVPIEYLLCVEEGARKCMHGHTFNLLYRDLMVDKLTNREPTPEETQILNYLLALQRHCNIDLYPRALATCLARDKEFLEFHRDPDNRAPYFKFEFRKKATVLPLWVHGLTIPRTHCSVKPKPHFFSIYSFRYIHFLHLLFSFLLRHN